MKLKKIVKYEEKEGALDNKQYASQKLMDKLNREARKCALYDTFLNIK